MNDDRAHYDRLELALRYHRGYGELAPYLLALAEGCLLGASCPGCDRCWCPPRAICPNDGYTTEWLQLPPTGTLLQRTDGPGALPLTGRSGELAWGLVRIDGCVNAMTARLVADDAMVVPRSRVQLVDGIDTPAHPAQYAVFASASRQ